MSYVGCLQHFSDRSHKFLSASPLQFYFLCVMFLNFSGNRRRALIPSRKAVVACLLVSFDNNSLGNSGKEHSRTRLVHSSRTDFMKALHKCIEHCLVLLASSAMKGLPVTTKDFRKIYCRHPLS